MQGRRKAEGRLFWPPHQPRRRCRDLRRPIPHPMQRPGRRPTGLGRVLEALASRPWPALLLGTIPESYQ